MGVVGVWVGGLLVVSVEVEVGNEVEMEEAEVEIKFRPWITHLDYNWQGKVASFSGESIWICAVKSIII